MRTSERVCAPSRVQAKCVTRSIAPLYAFSAALQKPIGESAVADATMPARASSSAIPPPSELPTTCGRSIPSSPHQAATARASAATVGSSPPGKTGESPKPGRSTTSTSRSAASSGTTGFHTPRREPIPWIRTSGGLVPVPVRS